jgi:hypothetical protein
MRYFRTPISLLRHIFGGGPKEFGFQRILLDFEGKQNRTRFGLWVPAHVSFPLDYPENPKPHSFSLNCQNCMSSEINPKATMVA